MAEGRKQSTSKQRSSEEILRQIRQDHAQQQRGYREQALKLFPWVCGRCTREFTTKNVRELTVHHKDHNHDNNPADGSNWELLCIYCHDQEHSRDVEQQHAMEQPDTITKPTLNHSPFAALAEKFKK